MSAGRNILEVTHMQEIPDKDNEYILVLYSTLGPKDYLFYIILFISVFAFLFMSHKRVHFSVILWPVLSVSSELLNWFYVYDFMCDEE